MSPPHVRLDSITLSRDSDEKNLDHSPPSIQNISVLGAGTMGHGIAQVAAASGYDVLLKDVDEEALARGMGSIERNLAKGIERGKLTEADLKNVRARIRTTTRA